MKYIFSIFLLFCTATIFAQTPNLTWGKKVWATGNLQIGTKIVTGISNDTTAAAGDSLKLITEYAAKKAAAAIMTPITVALPLRYTSGILYPDTTTENGLATKSDLLGLGGSTPTLQQVLNGNHDLVNGNNYQGTEAGLNNASLYVIAMGNAAAKNNAANIVTAIGAGSAEDNSGGNLIAIGQNTAVGNTGVYVAAILPRAANSNSGSNVVAIGESAATNNAGNYVTAIGENAAYGNAGEHINSLGRYSAYSNTGNNVIAIGNGSANSNTYSNINAFGENALADGAGQTVLSQGVYNARLDYNHITDNRKYRLPDSSGTIALLSDITSGSSVGDSLVSLNDTAAAHNLRIGAVTVSNATLQYVTISDTTTATFSNSTSNIRCRINPNVVISAITKTLPAAPYNGQVVRFAFGGILNAAATVVVNTFTVAPNSGQGLIGSNIFYAVEAGDLNIPAWEFDSSNSKWYPVK